MNNNDNMSKVAKEFKSKRKRAERDANREIDREIESRSYASSTQLNFFIIRETYLCIAKQRKLKNAINRFYDYLGISSDSYNQIVYKGGWPSKEVINKLLDCGFAETLFRKDSPTKIKLGDTLTTLTDDYFDKTIKLRAYRNKLKLELETIRDPDNGYIVIATDLLVRKIINDADPDDTYDEFLDALSKYKIDALHLQKFFPETLFEFYKGYIQENSQNTD